MYIQVIQSGMSLKINGHPNDWNVHCLVCNNCTCTCDFVTPASCISDASKS